TSKYRSGKLMPSGRGQVSQVPAWGSHSAGMRKPSWAGVGVSLMVTISRQALAASGLHKPIPFVAGQLDFRGVDGVADAFGMSGADDGNDFRRMFEQPGQRGDAARHAAFSRHQVEDFAHVNAVPVVG